MNIYKPKGPSGSESSATVTLNNPRREKKTKEKPLRPYEKSTQNLGAKGEDAPWRLTTH